MENTDDQDNQPTEANAEPVNVANATSSEHMNGQVTGGPESSNAPAANVISEAGQSAMEISPENPPVTITHPERTSGDSASPIALRTSGLLARRQATNPESTELSNMNGNLDMPDQGEDTDIGAQLEQQRTNTQTPDPTEIVAGEGPLTPRNNAGPFVFDGSAGRTDARQLLVPNVAQVADANRSSS